jgi:hypothetical protein
MDVNGAYNGSEKFGPGYKFELFPSFALGWMLSNEPFMGGMDWLDKLKFRGSLGWVGDDSVGERWAYLSQWSSGGQAYMNSADPYGDKSPYTFYTESVVGNPDIHWETARKADVGFELSVLKNMFSVDLDLFREDRYDIIVAGEDRSIPSFVGIDAADSNLGETMVKGIELALGFRKQIGQNWSLSSNFAYTHCENEVIYKEDPELTPSYQKSEGFAIDQSYSIIRGDMMTSWDDVYASTPIESNQSDRMPGYYDEMDYNSDGVVDDDDYAPYGYTEIPENTFSTTVGIGYKKFSFMIQFYGVTNATKYYVDRTFLNGDIPVFFTSSSDYWSMDNTDGESILPSWGGTGATTDPYRYWYDASYLKINNAELSYNFTSKGGSQYKLYLSGNNLAFWSDLPDDRQENSDDDAASRGDYPSFKRFTVGFNINF